MLSRSQRELAHYHFLWSFYLRSSRFSWKCLLHSMMNYEAFLCRLYFILIDSWVADLLNQSNELFAFSIVSSVLECAPASGGPSLYVQSFKHYLNSFPKCLAQHLQQHKVPPMNFLYLRSWNSSAVVKKFSHTELYMVAFFDSISDNWIEKKTFEKLRKFKSFW